MRFSFAGAGPMGHRSEGDGTRLLRAVADGDRSAHDRLCEMFEPVVRSFIRRLDRSLSKDDVDDLVQETFALIWLSGRRFRYLCRAKTYVLAIARHGVREDQRQRRQATAVLQQMRERACESKRKVPAPPALLERREAETAIDRAIRSLTGVQREAFDLVDAGGRSVEEAARLAGCSSRQFSNRLFRARQALRRLLRGVGLP